jgi:hypothetical protein
MRPYANIVLGELPIESAKAFLQPGAFDGDPEIFQPDLKQLIVGQRCPGIFPTWHVAKGPTKDDG